MGLERCGVGGGGSVVGQWGGGGREAEGVDGEDMGSMCVFCFLAHHLFEIDMIFCSASSDSRLSEIDVIFYSASRSSSNLLQIFCIFFKSSAAI
jgi:hypothetical protein